MFIGGGMAVCNGPEIPGLKPGFLLVGYTHRGFPCLKFQASFIKGGATSYAVCLVDAIKFQAFLGVPPPNNRASSPLHH